MIRGLLAAIVALALVVAPAGGAMAACASEDPGPAPLLGLTAVPIMAFGDPDLGTRIGFESGDELLSYFRFDLGLARITDAHNDAALEQAARDISTKAEAYGMAIDGIDGLAPIEAAGVRFAAIRVVLSNTDATSVEYLAHGHDGRCFHKVRYSAFLPAVAPGAGPIAGTDARFKELMAAIGPLVAD